MLIVDGALFWMPARLYVVLYTRGRVVGDG